MFDFGRRDFDTGSGAVFRVVIEEFALGKNDFGRNEGLGIRSGSNDAASKLAAGHEFLNQNFRTVREFFCEHLGKFFFRRGLVE